MEQQDAPGGAIAAVDLGTNSFHLVVARPSGNQRFEIITREKEVVRLGQGSSDMKELAPDAVDRGIAALARMKRIADSHGAPLTAVATSAVREAENRNLFLDRARTEAGVDVQVVPGVEEARLIHLGVLQAVPAYDRRLLLVDIGGGSTELLVGEGGDVLAARSIKLGAIRLTERFFAGGVVEPAAVDACGHYVRAFLAPVVHDVRRLGFEVAVGSSGTITNIAQMAAARRGDAPRSTNNLAFGRDDLAAVVEAVVGARTTAERAGIAGLDDKRVDIIVGGALLLDQVFADLGIASMVVSDYALREGVLLDLLQERERRTSLHHLSDLRVESVLHVARRFEVDGPRSEHVTALALQLFEQTADLHGLDGSAEELLEAAGLLHNVGLAISHEAHHKHSYYVIRHSELLTGFTDREIELVAQVARYHRRSEPKAKHPEFAGLRPDDQGMVRTLAGILRLAIALDRGHAGVVRAVRCRAEGGVLTVTVCTDPGADASLERYSAAERRGPLESALGVRIAVEVSEEAPAHPAVAR